MRICFLTTLFFCICFSVNAQYKKASFLNRGGRTYGITGRMSFMGQADYNQLAVAFSVGKDQDAKRFFSWQDLEIVLPAEYSYNTTYDDYNSNNEKLPVRVTAKSLFGFTYRYNAAFYLLDNSNERNKVLPFVNLGANMLFSANSMNDNFTTNPSNVYGLQESPHTAPTISFGINAGAGVLWKISPKFGLLATGGYNFQTKALGSGNIEAEGSSNTYGHYENYKSHPYCTFGVRFRMAGND